MPNTSIDINCDMGESYGNFEVGNDAALLPYISTCSIACGFHGGDPLHIEKTLKSALQYPVSIGAHPAYPDLQGFGRRYMQLSTEELTATVKYQVAALKGMTESLGGKISYVKPHGALYNTIAIQKEEAKAVINALQSIDSQLALMGLAGSKLEKWAKEMQIEFIAEAFIDRVYEADGSLRSRSKVGAVIHTPEIATAQVLSILQHQKVSTYIGEEIPLKAQSFCIHGDNPAALSILMHLEKELSTYQITKKIYD